MRKRILLTTFSSLWLLTISTAQDYIAYYNHCNEGDRLIYEKEYAKALIEFEKAFTLVDYAHAAQLDKAASCAALSSDYKKCALYIKKAALHGMTGCFLNNRKAYKAAQKTYEYKAIRDSLPIWRTQHTNSINQEYASILDSLHFVDQRIIRGNNSLRYDKKYQFPSQLTPKNKYELDDSIFSEVLRLINKYGFPSEKLVGPEGYKDVLIILHHNFRKADNAEYLSLAIEALKNGDYLPPNFAWMYDQFHFHQGKPTVFYYGFPVTNPNQISEIDAKRKEFGVKPIAATPTIVRGKKKLTYSMKAKW